jgi:putative iron-dependent peroxidase
MTALGPPHGAGRPPVPQPVTAPITRTAIFLVVTVNPGAENEAVVRSVCRDLSALVRSVGHRVPSGQLSCILGFGSYAWDRIFGEPRPAELHPLREVAAGGRRAVSTPGDVLFHIRAQRMDLAFELETEIMARLGSATATVEEVQGFRYFDLRSIIGFVDGTENPQDRAAVEATIVGGEDPGFAGGSYVLVQKYIHDMDAWNSLSTEEQERVIGRTKLTDIELDDSVKPASAHNAVSKVVEDGTELKILRDNMAFGRAGMGEFGTYFIGYSRTPRVPEKMLQQMFVGKPEGTYDRLLDYSRAVTGNLFFAPSASFLEDLPPDR